MRGVWGTSVSEIVCGFLRPQLILLCQKILNTVLGYHGLFHNLKCHLRDIFRDY